MLLEWSACSSKGCSRPWPLSSLRTGLELQPERFFEDVNRKYRNKKHDYNLYSVLVGGTDGKESACSAGDLGFNPSVGRIP